MGLVWGKVAPKWPVGTTQPSCDSRQPGSGWEELNSIPPEGSRDAREQKVARAQPWPHPPRRPDSGLKNGASSCIWGYSWSGPT
jgi:hypothetical protein